MFRDPGSVATSVHPIAKIMMTRDLCPDLPLIDDCDQVDVSCFDLEFPCLHSPDSRNRDGTGSMVQVSPSELMVTMILGLRVS
jgi:hypothetical protein